MIKIKNNRKHGSLFHYAHFICDCLFPEIMNDIFMFNEVVRKKNIEQTLGNFSKIYEEVMEIKNTELLANDFNNLNVDLVCYNEKNTYCNKECFDKFRNFIFARYNIENNLTNTPNFNNNYPEVILIKRSDRIELIDDEYLKKQNTNVTTGKERREINDVDKVEYYLNEKYKNKFKSLYFENMLFKEQILYFKNAKLIVCAHGAVMSNMFFCENGTIIIEVICGHDWVFFDKIANVLELKHIKCKTNNYNDVVKCIDSCEI